MSKVCAHCHRDGMQLSMYLCCAAPSSGPDGVAVAGSTAPALVCTLLTCAACSLTHAVAYCYVIGSAVNTSMSGAHPANLGGLPNPQGDRPWGLPGFILQGIGVPPGLWNRRVCCNTKAVLQKLRTINLLRMSSIEPATTRNIKLPSYAMTGRLLTTQAPASNPNPSILANAPAPAFPPAQGMPAPGPGPAQAPSPAPAQARVRSGINLLFYKQAHK